MVHFVTHFLMHASPLLIYLIVVVVLMLESSGVPIVNNTLLLFTGAMASFGHLDIWMLALAAIIGSIAGACLAYVLGARGGRRILLRVTSFFHIEPQKVEIAERWFQRSGVWMIFFSRMTPYVRPFACFPAGISRMPFPRFFISASAGSIIWCAAMLAIGWYLGRRWELALRMIMHYTFPSLCVIALILAIYAFILYMIKRRLSRFQSSDNDADEKAKSDHHNLLNV
ncbi:MAG: DedA family protein [Chloroflexi bacterium]|nr:DedA family protein [Chloroflexota bacterium]